MRRNSEPFAHFYRREPLVVIAGRGILLVLKEALEVLLHLRRAG
jgi:hypothetical protein